VTDESSYRRLATLAHAGHLLAGVTSLDDAIDAVASVCLDLLQGDSAAVGRIDAARGLIRILRNTGDLADWEEERPDDEAYPLADFPWLDLPPERAIAWCGVLDDPELRAAERRLLESLGKQAMLTVPLVVDRAVWGVIAVMRGAARSGFGAEDLAAGEALSGMVGAALARMEERSELRALAFRDPLTGLANRRAVDDLLEELFAAGVTQVPVGVVLCDVNGLKAVNDVHGHSAGDALLREIARILSAEAGRHRRAVAARLGGDEFCLVVEDVDDEALDAIAARLTERAEAIGLGKGLSCGYAGATRRLGDAVTAKAAGKALMRLADAAQYRVKRSGGSARAGATLPLPARTDQESLVIEVANHVMARLARAGPDLVDRLETVAVGVSEVVDAGAWAVSRSDDGGPAVIVRNMDRVRTAEPDIPGYEPGVAFNLDDYPATRDALAGGTFWATLAEGDDNERGFLAASGYSELIGAGRTLGTDAWLVEVCGDALSEPLAGLELLLRVLVEVAIAGSDRREDLAESAVAGVSRSRR
jgi:diguanylate cyclase (GGDEF)-like protein